MGLKIYPFWVFCMTQIGTLNVPKVGLNYMYFLYTESSTLGWANLPKMSIFFNPFWVTHKFVQFRTILYQKSYNPVCFTYLFRNNFFLFEEFCGGKKWKAFMDCILRYIKKECKENFAVAYFMLNLIQNISPLYISKRNVIT